MALGKHVFGGLGDRLGHITDETADALGSSDGGLGDILGWPSGTDGAGGELGGPAPVEDALDMIAKRIQTSRARLDNPQKPIGVFMLAGPSGVGKSSIVREVLRSV